MRGKYVEFTELLGVAGGAGVSQRNRRRVAPIASLQLWLQAWSTYAEVLSAAFPKRAPHLWRYQVRSSQRFQVTAWLQYDLLFRRKLALDPTASWSTTDSATCLAADTLRPNLACFTCGDSRHMAAECPSRQSRQSGVLASRATYVRILLTSLGTAGGVQFETVCSGQIPTPA